VHPSTAAAPSLEAVKAKQQATWASGDYSAIAATITLIAERLIDAADLPAGSRVLDVAGGSGNAAIAAARAGCDVICTDYVPSLLDRARERAAAEHLTIELREADAEALPFEDAAFDAVTSVVGVMFTPDQERAAGELLRVCRPGGTIALANWTPDSFVGELFRTVGAHVPPPPGVKPPGLWGTEERLQELLGHGLSTLRTERKTFVFRYRSAEALVDFFRDKYGPTKKAFEALSAEAAESLYTDFTDLVRRRNRRDEPDGPVAVPADYLEVLGTRAA
jgi:SAM-dependent methyltransferase